MFLVMNIAPKKKKSQDLSTCIYIFTGTPKSEKCFYRQFYTLEDLLNMTEVGL